MGIGPSSKETTLHHYRDPIIELLSKESEIDFKGILVQGTPENVANKEFIAYRTGVFLDSLDIDGVIISIDSWGNSHVDFATTIEEVARRGIKVVGMSFVGNQASFVVTNKYMDTIIDINKTSEGIETTNVGQNTLTCEDAYKAVKLLINKIYKQNKYKKRELEEQIVSRKLNVFSFEIEDVIYGENLCIKDKKLIIDPLYPQKLLNKYNHIENVNVRIIKPSERYLWVNSILDFWPISVKAEGKLGEGITHEISNVKVMLTAVENKGFQPANIGSSEGILENKVIFNKRGTPDKDETIIHVDVILKEGQGRTKEGIFSAHMICDEIVNKIREDLKQMNNYKDEVIFEEVKNIGLPKVMLVKLVSGLGCMYDTAIFPKEPSGIIGAKSIMDYGNIQLFLSSNEYKDGALHSLT